MGAYRASGIAMWATYAAVAPPVQWLWYMTMFWSALMVCSPCFVRAGWGLSC